MPPPEVVMILLPLNEKTPTRPNCRWAALVGRAQRLSAASSSIGTP
jgi:hypothetical protein